MKWLFLLVIAMPSVALAEMCPCPSSDAQYTNYPALNYDPGVTNIVPPVQRFNQLPLSVAPMRQMMMNPYVFTSLPAGMPAAGLSPMTYAYPNATAFPMAAGAYPGMLTQPWVNNPMMNAFNGMGGPFNSGIPGMGMSPFTGLNNGFPFSMPW